MFANFRRHAKPEEIGGSRFATPEDVAAYLAGGPSGSDGWISYYCGEAPLWKLDCGHEIPLLEHERPDDPPRRPRLCPVCQKLRNVTAD